MIYGYGRVSTKKQEKDGNSLEAQEKALRDAGAQELYFDVFTGSKINREHFDEMKVRLKPGDRVVVTKLDRMARTTEEGLHLVKEWFDSNISVHVLNLGLIDNTPTGKLILTVMFGFAEFERDLIRERTREGREIARSKPGYKEGRKKKYSMAKIEHALELLNMNSYKQVEAMTGISKSTLIRAKRRLELTSNS